MRWLCQHKTDYYVFQTAEQILMTIALNSVFKKTLGLIMLFSSAKKRVFSSLLLWKQDDLVYIHRILPLKTFPQHVQE